MIFIFIIMLNYGNINLLNLLEDHIMHNYSNAHKRKISRTRRRNIRRRRTISLISILSIFFILSSSLIYKLYKKIKCRDLQYAVEYKLTSGKSSERLLRVQHITLKFNDNEKAIVEVSGLSKDEPHRQTTIKGTFKKGSLDSWNLENAERS